MFCDFTQAGEAFSIPQVLAKLEAEKAKQSKIEPSLP